MRSTHRSRCGITLTCWANQSSLEQARTNGEWFPYVMYHPVIDSGLDDQILRSLMGHICFGVVMIRFAISSALSSAMAIACAWGEPPPKLPTLPDNVLLFRRLHVNDSLMRAEAFSMLIPTDWKVEGGIVWRPNPSKPATAVMRLSSPDGRRQLEILPQLPFVDGAREAAVASARMAGPNATALMAARFAEGNLSFGNEVRRRVDTPAAFVRQVVLPRFRADLQGVHIVKEEDLPKVAEATAAAQQQAPPDYWAFDGVHPTAAGFALMARTWLDAVSGR
ncbi:MAG: hypothetical protein PCFJNLEI_00619 [Verrucomicrobiae bacterium]|nr:hypothetical protein [Verrucomicrobiae bacterium]